MLTKIKHQLSASQISINYSFKLDMEHEAIEYYISTTRILFIYDVTYSLEL